MWRIMASLSIGDGASACVVAGQFVSGSVVANDTKRQPCRNQGTGGEAGGHQPDADQTGAREHVGSSSVDRVEGDAGLDHGGSPDQHRGGRSSQQPGTDQTCSRDHVGSFRGGDVPPPLLRCNDLPQMDRGNSGRGAAPDP
jgi:hypothetical protein